MNKYMLKLKTCGNIAKGWVEGCDSLGVRDGRRPAVTSPRSMAPMAIEGARAHLMSVGDLLDLETSEFEAVRPRSVATLEEYVQPVEEEKAAIPLVRRELYQYRALWASQPNIPWLHEERQEVYNIVRSLGTGSFSNVFQARARIVDESVAIKIIDKRKVTRSKDIRKVIRNVRRINTEVSVMRELWHEGIVRLIEAYQTEDRVFLVLEHADMDLFCFLKPYAHGLPLRKAQYVDRIVALSIRHMHARNIAHRDIKPENILVGGDLASRDGANLKVKLCDFGLSLRPETKCSEFVGSPGFFAPEILLEPTYDPFAADIWSFGAVVLETVVGTPAFSSQWVEAYKTVRPSAPVHAQATEFRHLITCALDDLHALDKLTQHPGLANLISSTLTLDVDRRHNVQSVVLNPWLKLVDASGLEINLRLTYADDIDDDDDQTVVVGHGATSERRDAFESFQCAEDGSPSRLRSASLHQSRPPPRALIDVYTLPQMTICHLDDSSVARRVVQAKLAMAFPNHAILSLDTANNLIDRILAAQHDSNRAAVIGACIFDENLGEDHPKGSDLARALRAADYRGLVLCMTGDDDVQPAQKIHFDGVIPKVTTNKSLKTELLRFWSTKFGERSLVAVGDIARAPSPSQTDDDAFAQIRLQCLEHMVHQGRAKRHIDLTRADLLEMKGDMETVKCSDALVDIVCQHIGNTSPDDCVPYHQDTQLFQAISAELDFARRATPPLQR